MDTTHKQSTIQSQTRRVSTIPPVSTAAVYWAHAHGQIADEWLRLHLAPAALEVRGGEEEGKGREGGWWVSGPPDVNSFYTAHTQTLPPNTTQHNATMTKTQGADGQEAWIAIGWLLELLHLPALRYT